VWRETGYTSLEDFLVGFWEGFFLDGRDANNLLCMLDTWQRGNVGTSPAAVATCRRPSARSARA
jgi:homoserine O-acetyltransferase/O-succinyltransferase